MMGILLSLYPFNIILAHEDEEEHEEYLKENPTFTIHRYMGYAIIIGSAINVGTGLYLLEQYENGKVPPDYIRIPHRAIGYTVFTLSTIQTALGTYNNIKLWNEEGRFKRLIHGALAYAATVSYLYAGYKAYKAGYKPNKEEFETHGNFMLLASGLSALAGLWIIF